MTIMNMPNHMYVRCAVLQAELHQQGVEATMKDCHDLLVAEALERIMSQRVDTVSA